MRGVAYVNVPTTLLAQHDAAVGGKVAVNTSFAKNFVGAFHHPRAVFSDPATLATLDDRHIAAGIAEAIKVAICGDERCSACWSARSTPSANGATRASSARSCGGRRERRSTLLAPDPYENDLRRALNLGHSFGHPLETELEYTGILHGEAVGFGLAVATEVSRRRGVVCDEAAERISRCWCATGCRRGSRARGSRRRARAWPRSGWCAGARSISCCRAASPPSRSAPDVADDEVRAAIDAIAWHPRLGSSVIEAVAAEQNRMLTLGVDVGGTKLLACVVDDAGVVVEEVRHETGRATAPADLVRRVGELVWRFRSAGRAPAAIGVGIPGLCDHRRGIVRSSIMLDGWRDVPLADELRVATGLPCAIDNDVNTAALAEAAARGLAGESMLFVAIGTGIGGAITFGQELWRGASGVAGEIGNIVIDRGGPRCWCGRRGCLNTLASGSAIETAAGITPGTLAAHWRSGDRDVAAAVDDAARALATGLGNAINLLNPSLVVLGGGVAQLGSRWLGIVRRHLAGQAFAEAAAVCDVELAQSGYEAGARGAAMIARAVASDAASASASASASATAPGRVA